MKYLRRAAATTLSFGLVAAGVVVATAPAEAASYYRYWSYWHVAPTAASWAYAGTGPGGYRVDDGAVEGWRFVVAAPNPAAPKPRSDAAKAFMAICGSTPRPAGKDRVAVVVDYGTSADAPPKQTPPSAVRGTCVVVDDRSNGLEVLVEAGYVIRSNSSGLICGLSGYPAKECGVVVKQPSPTPTATTKPSPRPTPVKSSTATPSKQPAVQPSAATTVDPGSPSPSNGSATPPRTSPSPATSSGVVAITPAPSSSAPALVLGAAPANPSSSSGGTPAGLLLGVGLVVAVGAAASLRTRRRTNPGLGDSA